MGYHGFDLNLFFMVISILLGFVCIGYVFGIAKMCGGKLALVWRIFFVAFILFIIAKLLRLFTATREIDPLFAEITATLFLVVLFIGLVYKSREVKKIVCNHKRVSGKSKRKRR